MCAVHRVGGAPGRWEQLETEHRSKIRQELQGVIRVNNQLESRIRTLSAYARNSEGRHTRCQNAMSTREAELTDAALEYFTRCTFQPTTPDLRKKMAKGKAFHEATLKRSPHPLPKLPLSPVYDC